MHHTPRKTPFNLSVKRSKTGLGVFTNVAIPKRRFIFEYWGDLLTEDEANKVGGKYLFDLGNGKVINGTIRANTARYLNHSCRPNCEAETVGNKVFIYSRRAIKPGEELTYDYGKDYFEYFIGKHCQCPKHSKKA